MQLWPFLDLIMQNVLTYIRFLSAFSFWKIYHLKSEIQTAMRSVTLQKHQDRFWIMQQNYSDWMLSLWRMVWLLAALESEVQQSSSYLLVLFLNYYWLNIFSTPRINLDICAAKQSRDSISYNQLFREIVARMNTANRTESSSLSVVHIYILDIAGHGTNSFIIGLAL